MRRILLLALATVLLSAAVAPAAAQSVVTYTGQLLSGSSALSGTYDFQFQLYDAPTIGNAVGPLLTETSVPVAGGVFYTELNFGKVFTGKTLYLQTAHRIHPSSGSPAYTVQPVRKLAPVSAYSVYAPLSGNTKALQGKTISSAAPAANQVLTWSGTAWTPADALAGPQGPQGPAGATGPKGSTGATGPQGPAGTPGTTFTAGTGLSLSGGTLKVAVPLSLSGSSSSPIVSAANTGSGYAVSGSIAHAQGVLGGVVTVTAPIAGTFTDTVGVYASDTSPAGSNSAALIAASSNSVGIIGISHCPTFDAGGTAVLGVSENDNGVGAFSVNDTALYSESTNGLAAELHGDATVSGTLTAGAKHFKIDHPLDPENKYLVHASVESDQMLDIYAGHVTLGKAGTAVVLLPDWFEALNGDFEYHLTAIGAPGPNLYVAQEISNGRFTIAGGRPGSKVSWQVTGVRHDAFALGHPLDVEQDKPDSAKGTYLDPKDFGQPESRGENYARHARTRARWLPSPAQP